MTTEPNDIQREKWFLVYSIDGFEHRCMRDTIIKMFDNEQEVLKEVEKLKERGEIYEIKLFKTNLTKYLRRCYKDMV